MKKILTIILVFCSLWVSAQLSSAKVNRIQNASTAFGFNIPQGDILYDANSKKFYGVILARTSTEKISDLTLNVHIKDLTPNYTVQTLSGTTPSWVGTAGLGATITLSGNTTITLSNLVAGQTGNIEVINASASYTLTVAGYTNEINQGIYSSTNVLQTSGGGGKKDNYSWWYTGSVLKWNGGLDYK